MFRSGARKFWSCFVNLGLSSYLMEKNVELYLDKPGGLFMVVYGDDFYGGYYSGRHVGETEFINMNRDRIRDIKIDLCC